jgi:hypothetical protein
MTFGRAFNRMTFDRATCSITTFGRTLSKMTFSRATCSITTFRRTTFGKVTFSWLTFLRIIICRTDIQ